MPINTAEIPIQEGVDNPNPGSRLAATWQQIADTLRGQLNTDTFQRWFKDIELLALDDAQASLSVPNHIHQVWIEDNFLSMLRSAMVLAIGSERAVKFVISGEKAAAEPEIADVKLDEEPEEETPSVNGINPRHSFDTFVRGANNEYAAAACEAVAANPGKVYNPLFLHGGVGLGKTHLMQAIGLAIAAKKKGAKVVYITSERFTNEFIDAIQTGGLVKFRRRYRQADVLLIDDIQFLGGKERSQEEFFHTFNTLFDGRKQIVLSSDRPPTEMANNLEERLVSRFNAGLTAELAPPDVETREAILRKKASAMEVTLGPEVIRYLAQRVRSNVRTLEGALTRVASFTSLTGKQPTTEKIEHLLKDILSQEARRVVSIEQIQKRVAEHYDVRIADMTSKRRPANIAFPRQVAMFLARELTKSSLSEIGEAFGGRDHGTVLHAHRLVKERIGGEESLRQTVSFLETQLVR